MNSSVARRGGGNNLIMAPLYSSSVDCIGERALASEAVNSSVARRGGGNNLLMVPNYSSSVDRIGERAPASEAVNSSASEKRGRPYMAPFFSHWGTKAVAFVRQ